MGAMANGGAGCLRHWSAERLRADVRWEGASDGCCLPAMHSSNRVRHHCGVDSSGGVGSPLRNLLADKAAAGFRFGIEQADFPRMELHGGLIDRQGRSIAQSLTGQVERIADDGKAGLPEMDSDLVGSTCLGDRF